MSQFNQRSQLYLIISPNKISERELNLDNTSDLQVSRDDGSSNDGSEWWWSSPLIYIFPNQHSLKDPSWGCCFNWHSSSWMMNCEIREMMIRTAHLPQKSLADIKTTMDLGSISFSTTSIRERESAKNISTIQKELWYGVYYPSAANRNEDCTEGCVIN